MTCVCRERARAASRGSAAREGGGARERPARVGGRRLAGARVCVRTGRREQHVLKVLHIHLERVALAAHVDEDLDHLLDQLAVHHLAFALPTDQLEDRRSHVALHRVEHDVVEGLRTNLGELMERQPLDVKAVQVLEHV